MLLHTKARIMSIHDKVEVLDEADQVVYSAESKVLSIHHATTVRDAQGREVAKITQKPLSLHETHDIEMASGEKIELRTELFHVMKDVIDLEGLGWRLHGDILEHDYEILDQRGQAIASAHHKWVSVHDVYYIDVMDESQMDKIVCVYLALEQIIRMRELQRANAAGGAAAAGTAANRDDQ